MSRSGAFPGAGLLVLAALWLWPCTPARADWVILKDDRVGEVTGTHGPSLTVKFADGRTDSVARTDVRERLTDAVLAREVRGKVMAFRETDFILAAKEMGASDLRIIFRHLYPNSLSHIIVILTLTIPQIILAEAFLSFLGIGIQPPLTSWGLLMHDAQNLQTLGTHPWIMSPVVFIIIAVLGFNFLGDGLRDAADPYSII